MTAEETIQILESNFKLNLMQVRGKNAVYQVVLLRCILVIIVFKQGTTAKQLATILGVDRLTIHYYRYQAIKMFKEEDQFFGTLYRQAEKLIKEKEVYSKSALALYSQYYK